MPDTSATSIRKSAVDRMVETEPRWASAGSLRSTGRSPPDTALHDRVALRYGLLSHANYQTWRGTAERIGKIPDSAHAIELLARDDAC